MHCVHQFTRLLWISNIVGRACIRFLIKISTLNAFRSYLQYLLHAQKNELINLNQKKNNSLAKQGKISIKMAKKVVEQNTKNICYNKRKRKTCWQREGCFSSLTANSLFAWMNVVWWDPVRLDQLPFVTAAGYDESSSLYISLNYTIYTFSEHNRIMVLWKQLCWAWFFLSLLENISNAANLLQ